MLDEKQAMKDMGKKRGSKATFTLRSAFDKPWLTMDPRARNAYWITYATVVVFGLGMGALRIYLGQRDVILQDPRSLCPVLSEDFTGATTESVFGDNGWLAREGGGHGWVWKQPIRDDDRLRRGLRHPHLHRRDDCAPRVGAAGILLWDVASLSSFSTPPSILSFFIYTPR
ncbi:hypothetical protein C8J57DRAFT_766104 [Mycena rebaudengoi]|nr:hypothetical protein C8J57DRAFT_766104 [Mycena rebaudengoi]